MCLLSVWTATVVETSFENEQLPRAYRYCGCVYGADRMSDTMKAVVLLSGPIHSLSQDLTDRLDKTQIWLVVSNLPTW